MKLQHGNTTHGGRHTRLYAIWCNMKTRCNGTGNEEDKSFYFDKQISVCESWKNSFENFRQWAISNGYNESLTIDRICGNDGYHPDNCRWATAKQQANNTKRNVFLTLNGRRQTIAQWAEELNISAFTIYQRIRKLGWSEEKALTQPVKKISRIRN